MQRAPISRVRGLRDGQAGKRGQAGGISTAGHRTGPCAGLSGERQGGRRRRCATIGQPPQGESGLPIPRFVSLKSDRVNVRKGPSTDQAIVWVFNRAGLPVEVIAESENWRRVRDSEGADGWVFHSLLSGRRTVLVEPWSKDHDSVPLYANDSTNGEGGGRARDGRARQRALLRRRVVQALGQRFRGLCASRTSCGASIAARRSNSLRALRSRI